MKIWKQFGASAMHYLPNHNGQCAKKHGHNYKIEVYIEGPIQKSQGASDEGMVIDFGDLKKIYNEKIDPFLDHNNLNESVPIIRTTAELLALWILDELQKGLMALKSEAFVHEVRVWETDSCGVSATSSDLLGQDMWWKKSN